MNKKIIAVLISVALLSACAGKTASPIPQPQCCNDTKQKPKDNKTKIIHLNKEDLKNKIDIR